MLFFYLLLDYSIFSITLPLEKPEQTADICAESLPCDLGVDADVEPPVPLQQTQCQLMIPSPVI